MICKTLFVKRIIPVLFILFFTISSNAQLTHTIDSIRNDLKTITNDSLKIRKILNLSWAYNVYGNDSSLVYVNKALELAKSSEVKYEEGHCYYALGVLYYKKNDYTQSILNLHRSLEIYQEINSLKGQFGALNHLGIVYSGISNLSKSLDYYLQAIAINKVLKDSTMMAILYNNMGVIYSKLNFPEKAIYSYNQALEVDKALFDTVNIIFDYNNLSDVNLKINKRTAAREYLSKAYHLSKQFKVNDLQMTVLNQSLGEYFLDIGQLDSAYYYLNSAYIKILELDRTNDIAYAIFMLGKYYHKANNYNKAILFYKKALALTESFEFTKQNADILFKLSQIYNVQNNFKEAYETGLKSRLIIDSLNFNNVRKALADYELQNKLEQTRINVLLEQEKNRQELEYNSYRLRMSFIGMIILFVMVLLVMGAFIRAYLIKKKSHKILEGQNTVIELQKEDLNQLNKTKDKFFSLIAHDLKNPFNILIGYSDLLLYDEEYRSQEKIDEILSIINRTAVLSHTFLENLLDWARSQSGTLKVEAGNFKLNELIQDNIDFFAENASLKGIKLQAKLSDDIMIFGDRKMIDTVIRNLISNAIKFTNIGGKVEITNHNEGNASCISIIDNGLGISDENIDKLFKLDENFQIDGTANEKGTGLGLILCKEFIDKNNGTITVESKEGKGSTFSVCLPLAKII